MVPYTYQSLGEGLAETASTPPTAGATCGGAHGCARGGSVCGDHESHTPPTTTHDGAHKLDHHPQRRDNHGAIVTYHTLNHVHSTGGRPSVFERVKEWWRKVVLSDSESECGSEAGGGGKSTEDTPLRAHTHTSHTHTHEGARPPPPQQQQQHDTLPEAFHSICVPPRLRDGGRLGCVEWWRTLMAYVGPGYMVAVGYMDAGNWVTDLAGGALFGFSLLSVVLVSSLMAIFLQVLTVRLGVATKRDLAQLCRESFSARTSNLLWITAEIAICACDLAEVIGSAMALELLFGLPMAWGCFLTGFDVLVVLWLFDRPQRFWFLEITVMVLIALIFSCFAVELVLAQPSLTGMLEGFFLPDASLITNPSKLYIAMAILGATVMPHNLYLHSSIVQTRAIPDSPGSKREAIRFSSWDTVFALGIALFVNAAILIVAAATFYDPTGSAVPHAPSVMEAYDMLAPMLGTKSASLLFGIALLAAGQNSTLTGTLAGQIIMEGFLTIKLKPWLRRLVTRLTVVVPAIATVLIAGPHGVDTLLVLSQVVLSMQLSFAVFPLVMFTSDPEKMGTLVNGPITRAVAWITAWSIAILNAWLLVQTFIRSFK